ncbi:Crp/Fnr family transcriptional regulator [Rubrivirga sp. IMCC45206]|uniref:Crp/Fnr family transcriptional regulator n=1 Tax=Rubrivirga sp. IMCC45206 TaxID=3391614 RepID=UPI00398FF7B7
MASAPPVLFATHDGCEALTETITHALADTLRAGPSRRYGRSDRVWERGDPADEVYYLHLGAVEVSMGGADGLLMHRVAPGEPFGMLCLCAEGGGRRPSAACVVADSEVTSLGLADVLAHLQRSPSVLLGVMASLCERAVEAEARAEILTHRDAEGRLARLLLHLARVEGSTGDGPARLALTHDQIARLAAMSRAHVSVVLGAFRDRGLVDYAPGRPLVPDVDALRGLLQDDAD